MPTKKKKQPIQYTNTMLQQPIHDYIYAVLLGSPQFTYACQEIKDSSVDNIGLIE